jgi:Fe2+ transport system protein FeoA
MTLKDLKPGECGQIRLCGGDGVAFQRLCEMGLVEGADLRVVRHAPFGDPMEIEINQCHLFLRKAQAAMVEVDPV